MNNTLVFGDNMTYYYTGSAIEDVCYCVHPQTEKGIEEELLILEKSQTISIDSIEPITYICYCSKCKNLLDIAFSPWGLFLWEREFDQVTEDKLKILYRRQIDEIESYTSIW